MSSTTTAPAWSSGSSGISSRPRSRDYRRFRGMQRQGWFVPWQTSSLIRGPRTLAVDNAMLAAG